MQQDQQMMIFMLLVVVALMMSRDTHKLFAETTRTWAQFGSNNYKAISALTTIAMLAIGRGVYKNSLDIQDNKQYIAEASKRIGQQMDAKIRNPKIRDETYNPKPNLWGRSSIKKRPTRVEFLTKHRDLPVDETHRHFKKIQMDKFKKKLTDISNNSAYDDSYDDFDANLLIQQRPITYASPGLDEQALH
tara:strand:+ start:10 stop:579 length:570 start_codon:yes stop_codon:yes gene_type:complete